MFAKKFSSSFSFSFFLSFYFFFLTKNGNRKIGEQLSNLEMKKDLLRSPFVFFLSLFFVSSSFVFSFLSFCFLYLSFFFLGFDLSSYDSMIDEFVSSGEWDKMMEEE